MVTPKIIPKSGPIYGIKLKIVIDIPNKITYGILRANNPIRAINPIIKESKVLPEI